MASKSIRLYWLYSFTVNQKVQRHFRIGFAYDRYLGEIVNKSGTRWEIQLKGSGLTPFSRSADGRKVLRSTIREFLCSEVSVHVVTINSYRHLSMFNISFFLMLYIKEMLYKPVIGVKKCMYI